MKKAIALLITLTCIHTSATSLEQISWLSGAWQGTTVWGPADLTVSGIYGNRMLGAETLLSAPTNKDSERFKIAFYEHFEIRQNQSQIELEVFPPGQSQVTLSATMVSDTMVIFENPEHSFPSKWSFELKPDGTLEEKASGSGTEFQGIFSKAN